MQIGRRILFNKITGEIIVDMGEMEGDVLPRIELQEGDGDIGILDLPFGAYVNEFRKMISVKVNTETRELEFELSTEQTPEEKIAELENQLLIAEGVI